MRDVHVHIYALHGANINRSYKRHALPRPLFSPIANTKFIFLCFQLNEPIRFAEISQTKRKRYGAIR